MRPTPAWRSSAFLLTSALVASLLPDASAADGERDGHGESSRFAFERPAMGTTFRIVVYASDEGAAGRASNAAFATVARLDSLLSDYRTDSGVALLARSAPRDARVSDELLAVLTTARAWSYRTAGAFDVTVGPLTRLWRWSARRGELPDPERLAAARALVGYDDLRLDPEAGTARLMRRGMSLDLGGIGKGWAADAAMRELHAYGLASAVVDAGGDVLVGAPPPDEAGWRIRIPGDDRIVVSHAAVATSGDGGRGIEVEGIRYSHIVDPRTGLGVPYAPTVTVAASDAATADVLASALTVLEPEEGARLVASEPGASARMLVARSLADGWLADPHVGNAWITGDFPKRIRTPTSEDTPWRSP